MVKYIMDLFLKALVQLGLMPLTLMDKILTMLGYFVLNQIADIFAPTR